MMRLGMTISVVLFLGHAGAAVSQPSDKDLAVQELSGRYLDCLIGEAQKLDDHVSDAATIASGIADLCGPEMQHIKNAVDQGVNVRVGRMLDQHLDGMRQSTAITAVLKERQMARAAHSN